MITHLRIQDFAIIQTIDIDFNDGLNIITGETGSGKSIIIEAVSMALGTRADTTFVRTGKSKASIQMVVEHEDQDYVITREISANGKSLCKLNDQLITLSQLQQFCKQIVDIHGQYDHQSLLNPENHLNFIDMYDKKALTPVKERVSNLYEQYADVKSRLKSLIQNANERARKQDFMRFELAEIDGSNLQSGEDEELAQRITMLQNGEKITQNISSSYEMLFGNTPSATEFLGKSLRLLEEIASYSPDIHSIKEVLSESYYKLEDLSPELRETMDRISFSPQELDEAIQRMDQLDSLKRKYGNTVEEILEYRNKIYTDLQDIENIDTLKIQLQDQLTSCEKELKQASEELSKLRKSSAKELEEKINQELQELNFKNAYFIAKFSEDIKDGHPTYSENGTDLCEFLMCSNKGEVPKPLAKIASGGEISRVMLAFKRIMGDYDNIPTMIFDEIDSGISGITATIVGKKLREISKNHQIICITHLPQIAAYGDFHYQIQKVTDEDSTHTVVAALSEEEKVEEIARLLGGMNITKASLENAKELIELSCK